MSKNEELQPGRAKSNIALVSASNILIGAGNFGIMVWYAHIIGPSAIGVYAAIAATVYLISALFSPGFDQAVIRDSSDEELASAAIIATVLQNCIFFVLAVIAIVAVSSDDSRGRWHNLDFAFACALGIVSTSFANLLIAPLAGRFEYKLISLARVGACIIGLAVSIAVAMSGGGAYALALRDACTGLALLAFGALMPARLRLRTSTRAWRALANFSRGMWALNAAERTTLRIDQLLVSTLVERDVFGAYFVVRGIIEGLAALLVAPIQTVLYSYLCRLQKNVHAAATSLKKAFPWYSVLLLVAVGLGGMLIPMVLSFLLDKRYSTVFDTVPWLLLYVGANIWFELVKVHSMSVSLHQYMLIPRLLQIAFTMSSMFAFVGCLHIQGAAMASAVGAIILALGAMVTLTNLTQRQQG